jgi:terminase small subunit / prophage DNA-packing protein
VAKLWVLVPGTIQGVNAPPYSESVSQIFKTDSASAYVTYCFEICFSKRRCEIPSYNLAQAATILEVDRATLSAWLARGAPAIERADRSRGREWKLSVAQIGEWRIKTAVDDAVAGLLSPDGRISKDEADRRKAVAQARLSEIEVDEKERSVVLVRDGTAILADFCQALKSGCDNGINKTAGRAATMTDPNEIREFLQRELNRSFEIAEALLDEKWAETCRGEPSDPDDDADAEADIDDEVTD